MTTRKRKSRARLRCICGLGFVDGFVSAAESLAAHLAQSPKYGSHSCIVDYLDTKQVLISPEWWLIPASVHVYLIGSHIWVVRGIEVVYERDPGDARGEDERVVGRVVELSAEMCSLGKVLAEVEKVKGATA